MTQPSANDVAECEPSRRESAPETAMARKPEHPGRKAGLLGSAWSRVPGSFGELIQGRFDGRDVLVSCPIDRYVSVHAELTRDGRIQGLDNTPRSRRLLTRLLERYAPAGTGTCIRLDSPLPHGKGMASSTADLCAVSGAVLSALDRPPTPNHLARLAAATEPSDGIMHPGLVLMDRHTGRVLEHYPAPPPLTLLGLDAGGRIDTLGFQNPEHEREQVRQAGAFAEAVAATREGLKSGCAWTLATGSTLSARLNQSILPNPLLEQLEQTGHRVGAHGVCTAHSGTLVGLLMPTDPDRLAFALTHLRNRFGPRVSIETLTPIGGGLVTGGIGE